ncbi:hypothetical protein [Parasphingorhabdus sp.]|uniref:hypothetical protein n=1 Tax=Parasphingorhabdus sp. TaxID=2709688 RepID=UPI003A944BC1
MVTLNIKPATLDREGALMFTGLSEQELRRHEKDGYVVFKPLGPNGKKVCPVAQLENLVKMLWDIKEGNPLEDMDFG